jgi:ABC-type sugar transport system ATPase subunit
MFLLHSLRIIRHVPAGDRDVINIPPKDRDIAMVFQNYALHPQMTAAVDPNILKLVTGDVFIGIRPEDVVVATDEKGLQLEVDVVEELGADGYLYTHTTIAGEEVPVVVRVDGRLNPLRGETIFVQPGAEHVHVFDAATGLRRTAV